MKKVYWILILTLIIGLIAGLSLSFSVQKPIVKEVIKEIPVSVEVEKIVIQTQTITEYIKVPVEVEVVKETEIYKEVEVTKEVEVSVYLKDWDSLDELKAFLDSQPFLVMQPGYCGVMAYSMRDAAQDMGKYLSVIFLSPTEYQRVYELMNFPDLGHVICSARVDKYIYYIEPANKHYWLGYWIK